MRRLLNWLAIGLPGLSLIPCGAARGQEVNPHIGHRHHHHRHGAPHATEPARVERFVTSREGAAALKLPTESDAFSFAVFGDRTGGPVEGVAVLADAVRDVNLLEPDLVMTVGDLVEGYTGETEWLGEMREFKEIMNRLLCPWFPVAGNHDIYWRGLPGKKPAGENERLYEVHFGPLWYAFEHKNCWFVVLYSDEGDPDTGEKSISRPESQRMSDEQFQWLATTLEKARGADHVFLFLHHPRWIGGRYGDDWERVHELLKSAGNVSAVFGGHIHRMRYDGPRDGIEYVALATTGGHKPGTGEAFGFLHHYDIVTVRPDRIALAAVPVGEVLDVREMTSQMVGETARLGAVPVPVEPAVALLESGEAAAEIEVRLSNPTSRPVEYSLGAGEAGDWLIEPDHRHGSLAAGAEQSVSFALRRPARPIDDRFREPTLALQMDYLAPGYRYRLPERELRIPLDLQLSPGRDAPPDRALMLDGKRDYLTVDMSRIDPGEALTLECRFKARAFGGRTGLATKTENSEFGIFVSGGRPSFSIHVGGSYLNVEANAPLLEVGRWHHVAGVYDGSEARLYVDGALVATNQRRGERRRNSLPLVIGADVTGDGGATSHFAGSIDQLRLSRGARYSGTEVEVEPRLAADDECCLLLQFDELIGPWCIDDSASCEHVRWHGSPELEPVAGSR